MLAANNYQPGDQNRSEIDPDSQVKGVEDFMIDAQAREGLYDFIARYVRKVCPDSLIMKHLRAMPGYTFLDLIRPSGGICNQPTEEWECHKRLLGHGGAWLE